MASEINWGAEIAKARIDADEISLKYVDMAEQILNELNHIKKLHVEVSGRNVTLHCRNLELVDVVKEYAESIAIDGCACCDTGTCRFHARLMEIIGRMKEESSGT
jgi:hypothetical protein